jgi:hypothetical protein
LVDRLGFRRVLLNESADRSALENVRVSLVDRQQMITPSTTRGFE